MHKPELTEITLPNGQGAEILDALPDSTVTERPVPAPMLAELRRLDQQIAATRAQQQMLINAFLWGAGIDTVRQRVNIDLDTGLYTVAEG